MTEHFTLRSLSAGLPEEIAAAANKEQGVKLILLHGPIEENLFLSGPGR